MPVEHRKVETIQVDTERIRRFNYSGTIRVFDAATGKEGTPMPPAPGCAPISAKISADGKLLSCVERPSQNVNGTAKDKTMLWDLSTGKKTKLCDDYARPFFLPADRMLLQAGDRELQVRERESGKVLAKWACPEKDRFFSLHGPSPDRKLISVSLGGKKGAPLEFRFLDAQTLRERGKLVGNGSPHKYGWGPGEFTPDGKRFAAIDASGDLLLWDLKSNRLDAAFPSEAQRPPGTWPSAPTARRRPLPGCRRRRTSSTKRLNRKITRSPASRCSISPARRRPAS